MKGNLATSATNSYYPGNFYVINSRKFYAISVPIKFRSGDEYIYFPLPQPKSPIKDFLSKESKNLYTEGQALYLV